MIGMAMFAILLSVGFSACSEDGPEAGGNSKEKKLVEAEVVGKVRYDITYDTTGEVSLVKRIKNSSTNNFYFVWAPNVIHDQRKDIYYHLNNNIVEKIERDYVTYTLNYNTNGHLESWEGISSAWGSVKSTFKWDGDKLLEYDDIKYYYENKTCKGYFPLIAFPECVVVDDDSHLFLTNPELIGMKTNQLPVKQVRGNATIDYSYTFTADGYIETCTIVKTYTEDVIVEKWKFNWK